MATVSMVFFTFFTTLAEDVSLSLSHTLSRSDLIVTCNCAFIVKRLVHDRSI